MTALEVPLPEGAVLLGKGGTFKMPSSGYFHGWWLQETDAFGNNGWKRSSIPHAFPEYFYAAPANSEIARLNAPAPAVSTEVGLLKAWRIDPAGQTGIDTLYVLDTESMKWSDVMQHAEYSLEQQCESSDGGGNMERPWNEMKVTITGVLLTPEEWEEINGNEY